MYILISTSRWIRFHFPQTTFVWQTTATVGFVLFRSTHGFLFYAPQVCNVHFHDPETYSDFRQAFIAWCDSSGKWDFLNGCMSLCACACLCVGFLFVFTKVVCDFCEITTFIWQKELPTITSGSTQGSFVFLCFLLNRRHTGVCVLWFLVYKPYVSVCNCPDCL